MIIVIYKPVALSKVIWDIRHQYSSHPYVSRVLTRAVPTVQKKKITNEIWG